MVEIKKTPQQVFWVYRLTVIPLHISWECKIEPPRLSPARYLPKRAECLQCRDLHREWCLIQAAWGPKIRCGIQRRNMDLGSFFTGSCPRGHLSLDEGMKRVQGAMAGGRFKSQGRLTKTAEQGPSEETRKCSWGKSSAFNNSQAQNAWQGDATLTLHTVASCLQPAGKGDLTLSPIHWYWNIHRLSIVIIKWKVWGPSIA